MESYYDILYKYMSDKSKEYPPIAESVKGNSLSDNYLFTIDKTKRYFCKIYPSKTDNINKYFFLYNNGVAMPKPIDELQLSDNLRCYISEYIPCKSIKCGLKDGLDTDTMKILAITTAHELQKLHAIRVDGRKCNLAGEIQRLFSYLDYNYVEFMHKTEIRNFILSNVYSTSSNRECLVHMDFHLDNILVDFGNQLPRLYFVDFENLSIDNFMRDFVYAAFFHDSNEDEFWYCFLQSYFHNDILDDFWDEMKLICYIHLFRMIVCEHQKRNLKKIDELTSSISKGFAISEKYPHWVKKYI